MSLHLTQSLDQAVFLREKQLIGNPRRGIPGILPISHATLWRKVNNGTFPRPVKLSQRTTAWPAAEVRRWIADPMGYRAEPLDTMGGQA